MSERQEFNEAKKGMVKALWAIGFPRCYILRAIGDYQPGRAQLLKEVLGSPFQGTTQFFREWMSLERDRGMWADFKYDEHRRIGPINDYNKYFAKQLLRWGIAQDEIDRWRLTAEKRENKFIDESMGDLTS